MQLPIVSGFDWDEANLAKCVRHGVSRDEIERLFTRDVLLSPDPWPGETRVRAIGATEAGRRVFLVFTIRRRAGECFIRPISARYMHAREWLHYVREASTDVSDG